MKFRRFVPFVVVIPLFLNVGSLLAAGEPKLDVLKVPGEFSITAPAEGFAWSKTSSANAGGYKVESYSCINPRSRINVSIAIEYRQANDDIKIAVLKGFYNGQYMAFQNGGFTFVEEVRPILTAPVPKAVPFSIHARSQEGTDVYALNKTCFSRNIYTISAGGNSKEDAQKAMDAVIKSFREYIKK